MPGLSISTQKAKRYATANDNRTQHKDVFTRTIHPGGGNTIMTSNIKDDKASRFEASSLTGGAHSRSETDAKPLSFRASPIAPRNASALGQHANSTVTLEPPRKRPPGHSPSQSRAHPTSRAAMAQPSRLSSQLLSPTPTNHQSAGDPRRSQT